MMTGSGESVLVMDRSADNALTVVGSASELLLVFGSLVELVTLAVLLRLPALVGVATIVTEAFAPLAMVPSAHVMVLVPLQLP